MTNVEYNDQFGLGLYHSDVYSGDVRFESQTMHQLTWLKFLVAVSVPPDKFGNIVCLKLSNDRFLPDYFNL